MPTGEYTLSGAIQANGKIVATNDIPLFVAGRDYKQPIGKLKRNVLVYDASNATQTALKKLAIDAQSITQLDKLKPSTDLLIVGEKAWDVSLATNKSKLASFVKAGGRVLCLGQTFDHFDPSWLSALIRMPTVSASDSTYTPKERPSYDQMAVNPEMPDHPIFAGVDRERLKFWSDPTGWDQTKPGFPEIYPIRYGFVLTKPEDLGHVAILADYDRGLEGVALAEMFDGKGSTLLCGLQLVNRIGIDPVADRMMTNLVASTAVPWPASGTPARDSSLGGSSDRVGRLSIDAGLRLRPGAGIFHQHRSGFSRRPTRCPADLE